MLELQNYGVIEMSSQEQVEVDGGIWPVILLVALYLYGEYYQSSHGMGGYGNP